MSASFVPDPQGGEGRVKEHVPELWKMVDDAYEEPFLAETWLGGEGVPVCSRCGLVVGDIELHRQWHRDITFGIHAAAWTATEIDRSLTERLAIGFRDLFDAIEKEAHS